MKNYYFENNCNVNYCAITGAASFFAGIRDAIIVINGSRFCYLQMLHHLERCFRKEIKNRLYCTELKENHIIFGSEEPLKKILLEVKTNKKISVIFIQNNCAASLIGDDLAGIAADIGFDCPIVCLDCGGIQGNFYDGYFMAAKNFFDTLELEEQVAEKQLVNIIGVTEGYYNFLYDKEEIERLLTLGNIQVLNCLAYDISLFQIQEMRKASLNIVIHKELGEQIAKILYEKYHIPYLILLPPYGIDGSKVWLTNIMRKIGSSTAELKQIESIFEHYKQECAIDMGKLRKSFGELWIDEVDIAGPYSIVLGLAEALRKELLNYRIMNLYIYSSFDNNKINRFYYHSYSHFPSNKCQTYIGRKNIFLFASFNEHLTVGIREGGYCCIAYPCNDYVSLGPYMGVKGHKRLLEKLWQYFIDASIKNISEG